MSSSLLFGVLGPFGRAQLACLRSWRCAGYRTAFFQLGGRRIPARLRVLADAYHFYPATMPMAEILRQVSEECARGKVAGLTTFSEALALTLHEQHRDGRFATVRYALSLLRHAPSRLDHPPRRDGKAFGGLAKALLPHRDEVFRLTDVVGNSAYLFQARS